MKNQIAISLILTTLIVSVTTDADSYNSLSGQVSSENTVSFISITSGFSATTTRRNLFQVPTASFDLDADSDTSPNIVEIDNDDDGLTDTAELFTHQTNHNDPDTDADTLTDQYEVVNQLNPILSDANTDKDGDGYSNLQEFQNHTDPSRYILKLNKGWNLMSLARIPTINSVSSILKGNKTGVVWGWDELQLKVVDEFDPLKGFWVYAPADADIEIQLP